MAGPQWGVPAWAPPPPRGPVAGRGARVGARIIDAIIGLIAVIAVLLAVGDAERPAAGVAIAWSVLAAYEATAVTLFGASLGKLAVGLRVVGLDTTANPSFAQAARRAAVTSVFTVLTVVGWIIWLTSTLTDALGRGIADRAADTMVVPKGTPLPIAGRDLPGYADGARPPRVSPLGRVGDLDVRARARLRRIVDAPVLAAAIGLLALAASLPVSTAAIIVGSSIGWVVVFVVDETRRVARTGATAGHHLAGLVIVDHRTGRAPTVGRSLLRALVLGTTLYVPVLWPVLVVSLLMMRYGSSGRGLHDLAGGTSVVADPSLDPEVQRQRAMRMRLGRAA